MLNPLLALSADATEVLPEFTLGSVLTDWGIDPIPFVVTVWAVGLYALGVATLRRPGDRWPIGRTVSFVGLGMGSFAVTELTAGRMCGTVVLTMGVGDGTQIADAMALTAKSGTVVVTNAHPEHETTVKLSLADLTIMEKRLVGSVFGGCNARTDIPMLIDLYRSGQLELDRLITRRYPLGGINQGYADMHAGVNIRGVLDLTR